MTRLKTKSTHGGIVGKAKTKQGTSLGQKIYKVHDKNTLWGWQPHAYSISVIPKGVRLRERSPAGFRWPSSCHYGRMVCFIFPLEYIFTAPLPWQSRRIISNTSRGMTHAAVTSSTSSYVFPWKIKVKRIEKFGRPLDRKAAAHTVPQCPSESCRIARATRSNVPNVREFHLKLTHHFQHSLHRLKGGQYEQSQEITGCSVLSA